MNDSILKTPKPHYDTLDGLRGVAALMVVAFHVFECYATDAYDQWLNHAYLAVDFFFMLSGFIMGHAYDDCWGRGMTFFGFMKRRVFRLHPMVVFGSLLGAALFYWGASPAFPAIASVPLWKLLLFTLLSILIIPTPKSADIRGNYPETYNLDGPIWSLSWEYVGNVLYALFVRRMSKAWLTILVLAAAYATLWLALTQGDVCGGWCLDGKHIGIGLTRLCFPFFGGLLLYRTGWTLKVPRALLWCSVGLVGLFAVPRIGSPETVELNGLFEAAVIFAVFPLVVAAGAGDVREAGGTPSRLCRWLGDISYPVYLVNYPVCYVLKGWVSRMRQTDADFGVGDAWVLTTAVFVGIVVLADVVSRIYDIPVRRWLRKRL
jgi:peptidoglycan/LPS O-acetylase OafA/YrhL